MSAKRNRPATHEAATPRTTDVPIIRDGADFDLVTAPACCLGAFLAGVTHGSTVRAQLEDERREAEDRAVYARAVRSVHAAANLPTHDELEAGRRRRTSQAAAQWATAEEWSA